MIALEDMKDMTSKEVKNHLVTTYAGTESGFDYGTISKADVKAAKKKLKGKQVLLAYESVGSWGCDSSSFFVLQDKKTKELFEVHGSHNSCYGFEGQLHLEPTTAKALKHRNDNGAIFYAGGYDEHETENKMAVSKFIESL